MSISELDWQRMQARVALNTKSDQVNVVQLVESERQLHYDILAECKQRGWICLHGSMAHRAHRTVGEPDCIIFSEYPRVFIIEAKSAKGKLSEEQVAMVGWFYGLGWHVEIVRSFGQFLKVVSSPPSRQGIL